MRLTPEVLSAAYSLLRETSPFKYWSLPDAVDVEFHVMRTQKVFGDCHVKNDKPPLIRLSAPRHERLGGVLATMAHEMIHLHLDTSAAKEKSAHGKQFQRCARTVLRHHLDFDPGTF